MTAARHLPLAIACAALAMALIERGHRLAREAETRRGREAERAAIIWRLAAIVRRRAEASPIEGGRPLDEHERMVLTVKRGGRDRIVVQRVRVQRPSNDGATS